MEKRQITAAEVPDGEWCFPQSRRPSKSYLRSRWQRTGTFPSGGICFRKGGVTMNLAPEHPVLINVPES